MVSACVGSLASGARAWFAVEQGHARTICIGVCVCIGVLQCEPAFSEAASAGDCAPKAAAAPASSAARRPHDATRSVAAAGTARGCEHGVRSAVALAASSTAIEALRMCGMSERG